MISSLPFSAWIDLAPFLPPFLPHQVLEVGTELAEAEGSQKAVGPLKDDKYLLLIRRKAGAISAIDANCGKSEQGERRERRRTGL